tara:strand:- start:1643 stop:1792 length:150 start_codon:yes stop_codon:yes gene_type:complete
MVAAADVVHRTVAPESLKIGEVARDIQSMFSVVRASIRLPLGAVDRSFS